MSDLKAANSMVNASTSTRAKHPCAGRSSAQRETFEAIAIGQSPPFRRQAFKALLDAGLIEKVGDQVVGRDSLGAIKVPVYEVPLSIHYQWCCWASENAPEDEHA